MPPELDIYGLTRLRDRETIDRFIDTYVDRAASEDRADEELMLEPESATDGSASMSDVSWEPALTLTHIVERGLQYPRRSFTVYLTARDKQFERVILSFTVDDQLIVGLAIDDAGKQPQNAQRARALLAGLMRDFDCHAGLIVVETPPAASEGEFVSQSSAPLTDYFVTSDPFGHKRA